MSKDDTTAVVQDLQRDIRQIKRHVHDLKYQLGNIQKRELTQLDLMKLDQLKESLSAERDVLQSRHNELEDNYADVIDIDKEISFTMKLWTISLIQHIPLMLQFPNIILLYG